MSEYNKCPNGHYYLSDLKTCPFCKGTVGASETETADDPVRTSTTRTNTQSTQTEVLTGERTSNKSTVSTPPIFHNSNKTEFIDDTTVTNPASGEKAVIRESRTTRKLVGWLVTYSFDRMGVDFKLYEGRNIIGRDMDCNITVVNDGMISGKHATLLFRSERYVIQDMLSTHGTYVNDEDIADEHYQLKDGDVIRTGQTVFKFRTSL